MEVLGRMTFARHSGADFEANRTGRPRGEHIDCMEVVDAREPEQGRAEVRQSSRQSTAHKGAALSGRQAPGGSRPDASGKLHVRHSAVSR